MSVTNGRESEYSAKDNVEICVSASYTEGTIRKVHKVLAGVVKMRLLVPDETGEVHGRDRSAELFKGIIISDHEAAFLKLGVLHQEYLAHILRYLRLVEENEPEKTWSVSMRALIQEMIHYWNGLPEPKTADPQTVAGFEKRFGECLQTAREEYAGSPPRKYFREGINLAERMSEKAEDYLLFLNNPIVEPTNNEAEQKARQFKRKMAEVMCFRSAAGLNAYCDGLSVMLTLKAGGENLYRSLSDIFDRPTGPA